MFRKNSKPLLFIFEKPTRQSIHSLFCKPFLAGSSIMPYPVFAAFAYAGAALWTITFISLGFFLGGKWHRVSAYSNRYIIPFMLLVAIFLAIAVYWKTAEEKDNEHKNKNDDINQIQ